MAFPNLMELFGRTQAPVPPVAAKPGDVVNGNPTIPNDTTVKPDGSSPVAFPKPGEGDASPLANFKDLWNTPKDKDGKPIPNSEVSLKPNFTIDNAKILAAAQGVDFVAAVQKADPALFDKAAKGDATALASVINQATQLGFAQAMSGTAKIVQDALTTQATTFETKYAPEMLRRHDARTEVRADNAALYENPAVTPIMEMIEARLTTVHPTASAAEIKVLAKSYITDLGGLIVTSSGKVVSDKPAVSDTPNASYDWEKYFGAAPNG